MITNKFRNRIMLNYHKLSITYPVWENRKSEAYLLFRGGEEKKFKYNFKRHPTSFYFYLDRTANSLCSVHLKMFHFRLRNITTIKVLLSLLFINNLSMPDSYVHNSDL